ncbi:MAG: Rieske (2Fe-2S) protein [Gemmatimonadaceae bacterium]|nr:Rieske (2Fe-2S) protein [Gemmatimonadaceae bacterium]
MRRVAPTEGRLELPLDRFPELTQRDGALRFQVAGRDEPIDVLAMGAGAYVALSPICTHLGCTVEVQGSVLVCPCHGSTFERSGRVVRGPAEQPLARYEVSLRADGTLIIVLDRPSRDA